MILNLKIENFIHIKKQLSIDVSNSGVGYNVIGLRGVVGSGKSNTFKAMRYICESLSLEKIKRPLVDRFNREATSLEVTFKVAENIYTYGFSVFKTTVSKEYLLINNEEFFCVENNTDKLYLKILNEKRVQEVMPAYKFFTEDIVLIEDGEFKKYADNTVNMIEENMSLGEKVLEAINKIYPNKIEGIKVGEFNRRLCVKEGNEVKEVVKKIKDIELKYNDHSCLLSDSSASLNEMFILLTHMYDSMMNNKILMIEEFITYLTKEYNEKFIDVICGEIKKSKKARLVLFVYKNAPINRVFEDDEISSKVINVCFDRDNGVYIAN